MWIHRKSLKHPFSVITHDEVISVVVMEYVFLRTGYDFVSVSAIGRRREADPLGQDKRREGGRV